MEFCPICSEKVLETDRIMLKWHEPKKWWVFYHLRLVAENEKLPLFPFNVGDTLTYKSRCVQANYNPATGTFN